MNKPAKKLLLTYLFAGVFFWANAQVMMQPQLPSQGLLQQNQLWNILVVNNGDPVNGGVIQLSFQEEGSGRKIFSAITGSFYLPRGASQLSVKDMGAIQYDYLSSSYSNLAISGGLLPAGRFIVCYNLLQNPLKNALLLSQDCLPVAVEPFSPPQLAYPADKSEIATSYPVFNWIAPAPVNMFTNLQYKLIVTEMKNGQSPADAIQRNPILFIQTGIKDMALPYPSSYLALQQGSSYAWQVIAQNDNTYMAVTEIWSFRVKNDSFSVVLDKAAYPHLQRGAASSHFIVQQKMKFSYDNEANDSLLTARVYAYTSQGNSMVFTRDLVLKRGMNFIDLDLTGARGLQKERVYVLEIMNSRKENWDLRFKYEPAN
ncbi:MAG TPA: hypothetical protein VNS58_02690 [Puia sp.]|nr:hypothetical protein [Puia sp.]